MNILQRIANLFRGNPSSDRMMSIYAMAHRSKELVSGKVDLYSELSLADDEGSDGYYVRKVLYTSGQSRIFEQVEIELWFDRNKRLDRHEVTGGRWLDAEAYAQEMSKIDALTARSTEHPIEQPADNSTDNPTDRNL